MALSWLNLLNMLKLVQAATVSRAVAILVFRLWAALV
jgi:hypothetical protein